MTAAKLSTLALAMLGAFVSNGPASAHHNFGYHFDAEKKVTVEGIGIN